AAILFEHLMGRQVELADDHVDKVNQPLTLIAPFGVLADDQDREGLLTVETTGARVGGRIALASRQQATTAAAGAAMDQRQDGGKGLVLERGDDPVVVEAAVQVEIGRASCRET